MSFLTTLSIMSICILLEAFFAGSEIAVVSVNRTHLKFLMDKGSKKPKHCIMFYPIPNGCSAPPFWEQTLPPSL